MIEILTEIEMYEYSKRMFGVRYIEKGKDSRITMNAWYLIVDIFRYFKNGFKVMPYPRKTEEYYINQQRLNNLNKLLK